MRTLGYQFQPLLQGAVVITAALRLRKGDDPIYLCDTWDQLVEAMDAGEPFLAHRVVGLKPVDLIVVPANVATIERES
jgi:hypothetical protein